MFYTRGVPGTTWLVRFLLPSILLVSPFLFQLTAGRSVLQRRDLPTAICADGSPGTYYVSTNSSSSDYVVYVMGGGVCAHDVSLCETIQDARPGKFSSDGMPDNMTAYGILSEDAEENPLYSTFNRVFVHYCTQDMYLLDTGSPDGNFQFRGRPILEETLGLLFGSLEEEASVVLVGSSAGGVGAFNVASWLLDSFYQVKELSVVIDSALFFDVEGYMAGILRLTTDDPSIAYSPSCSEEFMDGPCCLQFTCMMHNYYYPSDRVKGTFFIQPAQDSMPAAYFLGGAETSTPMVESVWDVATYAGTLLSELRMLADLFPSRLSVFAPSCIDHNILMVGGRDDFMRCPDGGAPGPDFPETLGRDTACAYDDSGNVSGLTFNTVLIENAGISLRTEASIDAWNSVQVNGTSVRTAMGDWWRGRGEASEQVSLFDTCNDINCNPTCLAKLEAGNRDESDSSLVWALVFTVSVAAMLILGAYCAAVVWGLRWATRTATDVVASVLREQSKQKPVSLRAMYRDLSLEKHSGSTVGRDVAPALQWRDLSYWVPKGGPSARLTESTCREPPKPTTTRRLFQRLRPRSCNRRSSKCCWSRDAPTEKQILYSVNGEVPKGALCALMGPSGAGKSKLLDLLTGRTEFGRCEGEVLFNGRSVVDQRESYISQSGYMRQNQNPFLDGLSVLDNLVFAVAMRYPGENDRKERLQRSIKLTCLEDSLDTKDPDLSGGQKRRLSLAMELLANRSILFLDEPTSGLDANGSLEVMTILKRLSSKEVTLVVSIHQPRPELWDLFSHAILLKAGRIAFSGPANEALAGVERYFSSKHHPTRLSGTRGAETAAVADPEEKESDGSTSSLTTSGGTRGASGENRLSSKGTDKSTSGPSSDVSVPDKILDLLVILKPEDIDAERSLFAVGASNAKEDSKKPRPLPPREVSFIASKESSVWKIAAVLMARRWRSGYFNKLAFGFLTLLVAAVFIAVSLRSSEQLSIGPLLVTSVLITGALPVVLIYSAVLVKSITDTWKLVRVELQDGFCRPICVISSIVVDQLAVAAVASLLVVVIMHVTFWQEYVAELPTSSVKVVAQASCALFLVACVSIGVMTSMGISGLEPTHVFALTHAINTIWSVFSGSVLLISSLPMALKLVTYASPLFWASNFALRVLLDGLDMSSSCPYTSVAYCASRYGDVIANSLDLHRRPTARNLVVLAAFAVVGQTLLVATIKWKSRNIDLFGGLRHPRPDAVGSGGEQDNLSCTSASCVQSSAEAAGSRAAPWRCTWRRAKEVNKKKVGPPVANA